MKFVPAASVLFLASGKEETNVPDEPRNIQFGTEATAGTTVPEYNIRMNVTVSSDFDTSKVAKEIERMMERNRQEI